MILWSPNWESSIYSSKSNFKYNFFQQNLFYLESQPKETQHWKHTTPKNTSLDPLVIYEECCQKYCPRLAQNSEGAYHNGKTESRFGWRKNNNEEIIWQALEGSTLEKVHNMPFRWMSHITITEVKDMTSIP